MSLASLDAACGQCTGVWEGASVSQGGDPTAWSETCIVFWPAPDASAPQRVTLEGHGVSQWRGMSIEFLVTGEADLATRAVRLRKQHVGQYTNVVEYTGTLELTAGGGAALSGVYPNGTIALRRRGGARGVIGRLLSGAWTGASVSRANDRTTWAQLSLDFDVVSVRAARVRGRGVSLWRSMHIDFDVSGSLDLLTKLVTLEKRHLGHYTNAVLYHGVLGAVACDIVGDYDNGTISLQRSIGHVVPVESSRAQRSACPKRRLVLRRLARPGGNMIDVHVGDVMCAADTQGDIPKPSVDEEMLKHRWCVIIQSFNPAATYDWKAAPSIAFDSIGEPEQKNSVGKFCGLLVEARVPAKVGIDLIVVGHNQQIGLARAAKFVHGPRHANRIADAARERNT